MFTSRWLSGESYYKICHRKVMQWAFNNEWSDKIKNLKKKTGNRKINKKQLLQTLLKTSDVENAKQK